jgi:protease I
MKSELRGRTIAFMAANEGMEQVEFTEPWQAVKEAGGRPELLAPEAGKAQAFNHLDKAGTFDVDRAIADAEPADYDALVLPGGVANPDQLRANPRAVAFVRAFFDAGKPVAAICHGPWTLIDAGVLQGRRITSWPSLKTDLTNAGADWTDEEVVVDEGLVSSRKPQDIPAFNREMLALFAGERAGQTRAARQTR